MSDSDGDDIRQLNDEADEAYTPPNDAAFSTQLQREAAWRFFTNYFESTKQLNPTLLGFPGKPASADSYLDEAHAPLDYRTCCAFLTHHLAGAYGNVEDRPSHTYLTTVWSAFCQHVQRHRGEAIDDGVQRGISTYLEEMMEAGHLSIAEKERSFTDGDGLRKLLGSVLSHDVPIRFSRTRLQVLLWMSMSAQTGHRVGASLPNDDQPKSREAQYRDFSLHISPHSDPGRANVIVISYEAPNHKTDESRFKLHTLIPQRYLALCPVFTFLVLAEMDEALPAPLSELLDPAYLGERKSLHLGMADKAREVRPSNPLAPRGYGPPRASYVFCESPRNMPACPGP